MILPPVCIYPAYVARASTCEMLTKFVRESLHNDNVKACMCEDNTRSYYIVCLDVDGHRIKFKELKGDTQYETLVKHMMSDLIANAAATMLEKAAEDNMDTSV